MGGKAKMDPVIANETDNPIRTGLYVTWRTVT